MSARLAAVLAVGLGCVAVGLSFVGRSRGWLHTRGESAPVVSHGVVWGAGGAGGARVEADVESSDVGGRDDAAGTGDGVRAGRSQPGGVEWGDVQTDCFGVAMGCLAVWLLPGKKPEIP